MFVFLEIGTTLAHVEDVAQNEIEPTAAELDVYGTCDKIPAHLALKVSAILCYEPSGVDCCPVDLLERRHGLRINARY